MHGLRHEGMEYAKEYSLGCIHAATLIGNPISVAAWI